MTGRVRLGLNGVARFVGFNPVLNWWKIATTPEIALTVGGPLTGDATWTGGAYLNLSTGELASPAPADTVSLTRIFFSGKSVSDANFDYARDFSATQWQVRWDGKATCDVGGLTAGGSQSMNNPAGSGTFTMGTLPGNTWLTFTLTDLADPPRNIRVYENRYATNVANGETFNPDWLEDISPFPVLRFMDWAATNSVTGLTDFSQLADENFIIWFSGLATGTSRPKGSLHPFLICRLANLLGCEVHVCIPHAATDDFVTQYATYFSDNLSQVVHYEYSNECWNVQFDQEDYCRTQGNVIWPADLLSDSKFYGYRSAAIMKIIRDVYNDRSRWRGVMGTQTVSTTVTNAAIIGVDYWRQNVLVPANSLTIADLYDEVACTGYFGDVQVSRQITGITKANPGVVTTAASHGYVNGQVIKLFVDTGMTELNDSYQTVANKTATTFELQGTNTSAMTAYASGNNYAHRGITFQLMDESATRHVSTPATYPTKYTYFNTQMATSWLTGSATDAPNTSGSVAALTATYWPDQKTVAAAHGLVLSQYEGGCHFIGDAFLSGFGGNPQFTEYVLGAGHTAETAAVYTAAFQAFLDLTGQMPNKFVESSAPSEFGTWGGIRILPSDEDNPVWQAIVDFNAPGPGGGSAGGGSSSASPALAEHHVQQRPKKLHPAPPRIADTRRDNIVSNFRNNRREDVDEHAPRNYTKRMMIDD